MQPSCGIRQRGCGCVVSNELVHGGLAGRDFFAVSAGDEVVQGQAKKDDAPNVIVANGAMAMGGGIPIQLTGGQYA